MAPVHILIIDDEVQIRVQNLHVFISQLRHKIEPQPTRPRYILTEPGVGYRFRSNM